MPRASDGLPWSGAVSDLLTQASAVLTREGARLHGGAAGSGPARPGVPLAPEMGESLLGIAARICPVTGATIPLSPPDQDSLRRQAHEFVGGLLGGFGRPGENFKGPADRIDPTRGTAVPGGFDIDRLRRQAHELIETLLATFGGSTGEKGRVSDNQVPLLHCTATVQAGNEGRADFCVANEEGTPSEVTLYCTDFISDSGHEIPALRVTVLPRRATIQAKGDAAFEIKIAVPQQTPAGHYTGLIQAMGNRYVKAVLMVEVT